MPTEKRSRRCSYTTKKCKNRAIIKNEPHLCKSHMKKLVQDQRRMCDRCIILAEESIANIEKSIATIELSELIQSLREDIGTVNANLQSVKLLLLNDGSVEVIDGSSIYTCTSLREALEASNESLKLLDGILDTIRKTITVVESKI